MKPREDGGVVDPKLNVYGVEGLKVAGALHSSLDLLSASDLLEIDLSVPPANVSAVCANALSFTRR